VNLVLDASIAIAWLFKDERTPTTQEILRQVAMFGAGVPTIWRLEVANVLRNAVRRGRCDEAYADRSLLRLARLRIAAEPETDRHAWGHARTIARDHNLTLYEAAYLELAIRRKAVLATQDAALIRAAGAAGIAIAGSA